MNGTEYRELLMASDLVVKSDSSGAYEVTVEVSEAGWADLSRLQLLAVDRAARPDRKHIDVLAFSTLESVRVHNTRELIRGQGHRVAAPAGVFSPLRQYGPIQFGKWWLEGGNIMSVRFRTETIYETEDRPYDLAYSVAFPFDPDNKREYKMPEDLSKRPRAYVASPIAEAYEDRPGSFVLEVRFDQDGIVDLDSLQLLAGSLPSEDDDKSLIATTVIESIELPTRQDLVLGGTSSDPSPRAVPGAIFASLERRFNWVSFGYLEVSTNNTLTVRVNNLRHPAEDDGAIPETYSMGLMFYPSKDERGR